MKSGVFEILEDKLSIDKVFQNYKLSNSSCRDQLNLCLLTSSASFCSMADTLSLHSEISLKPGKISDTTGIDWIKTRTTVFETED